MSPQRTLPRDETLKALVRNQSFINTITVIATNGDQIDFASARFTTRENGYNLSWQIFKDDGSTNVQFHKLSVDYDGKQQFVYLDDRNCSFVEPVVNVPANQKLQWPPAWWPSGTGGGGGGTTAGFCWNNWSAWVTTSQYCAYSFFCFGSNQRATFITQTRYCISNPNNKQTHTCKVHCGC